MSVNRSIIKNSLVTSSAIALSVALATPAAADCLTTTGSNQELEITCTGINGSIDEQYTGITTINIGDPNTGEAATIETATGWAVNHRGPGDLNFNLNQGSSVNSDDLGVLIWARDNVSGGQFGDVNVAIDGDISSNFFGLAALSNGGSVNITTSGDIETNIAAAIYAGVRNYDGGFSSDPDGGSINILANGDLSGERGVQGINFNGTNTSITTNGSVEGTFQGIWFQQRAGSGSLDITTNGEVTASGSDTENNYGNSYFYGGSAILANNSGVDLTITSTADVTGGAYGINATNNGTGNTLITVDNVSSLGLGDYTNLVALEVNNGVDAGDLTINSTGIISGEGNEDSGGINATNRGSGDTFINVNEVTTAAPVGTEGANAINVRSYGGDLTITAAGSIYGGNEGIDGENEGTGDFTINVVDVTGAGDEGLEIGSYGAAAGNMIVNSTGTITGGTYGIRAQQYGEGSNTELNVNNVRAEGFDSYTQYNPDGSTSIVSEGGDGINAVNWADTGNISITSTGTISGAGTGIRVLQEGDDGVDFDLTNVTGEADDGVFVENRGNGDVNITASGMISAVDDGIEVNSFGAGAISIQTVDSEATGETRFSNGIVARNFGGTSVDIVATGDVAGGDGIFAYSSGTESITISANNVTALQGQAITGESVNGGNINISATGAVNGETIGILANTSSSSGDINIVVSGVTTGGETGSGIQATTSSGGVSNITLNSGANVSATSGIAIINNAGDSNVVINDGATISGEILLGEGSDSLTVGGSADLLGVTLIDGGDDESADDGFTDVFTLLGANGTFDASTLLNWEEVNFEGSDLIANDLVRDELNVCGGDTTLSGTSLVANVLGCAESDEITVTDSSGIANVIEGGGGSDIINVLGDASISGGVFGSGQGQDASASADGDDVITINSSGSVLLIDGGIGDDTVNLISGTISQNVSGGEGDDTVTLEGGTIVGAIDGGNGNDIISLVGGEVGSVSGGDGTDVTTLNGSDVLGTVDGGVGADTLNILSGTVSQNVSGGVGDDTVTLEGGTIVGAIDGGNGNDIISLVGGEVGSVGGGDGVDVATLDGAEVSGSVDLGAENDILNYTSGSFGSLVGGTGTDILNFNAEGQTLGNTGSGDNSLTSKLDSNDRNISQFEIYNFITGGWTLVGSHTGLDEVNFLTGMNFLNGNLESGLVNVGSDVTLNLENNSSITGILANSGTLDVAGSQIGSAIINGDFTQNPSGVINFNVSDNDTFDQLSVSGDVNLSGGINVTRDNFTLGTITLIDGGTGLSGEFSVENIGQFSGDGLLLKQLIEYDLANFDVNLVSEINDASTIAGLTPNQASVANALVNALTSGNTTGELSDVALTTALLSDAPVLSKTLEELHPEEVVASIESFRNSQMLFLNNLISHSVNAEAHEDGRSGRQNASKNEANKTKIWGSAQYSSAEHSGTASGVKFDTDGYEFNVGWNGLGTGPISVGVAVGYADLTTDVDGAGVDTVDTQLFRWATNARFDLNRSNKGVLARLDAGLAYGESDNKIDRRVVVSDVNLSERQLTDTSANGFNGQLRLTLEGTSGKKWPIQPYVFAGADTMKQGAVNFSNGATALNVQRTELNRETFGAGANISHNLTDRTALKLHGTALFHNGDTSAALKSQFVSTVTPVMFDTVGEDIGIQYLIEGGLNHKTSDDLVVGLEGFGEFGDIEGYGVRLKVGKRF